MLNEKPKISDFLWVEKYRPRSLDDLVLDDKTKKMFEEYIIDKQIPHLLLYGGPGCGKSTTARILCDYIVPKEAKDMDILVLNGSDQRGINVVRNDIIEFLKYKAMYSKHKIVYIDEADYLTDEAFSALRNVYEEYYKNGRFILTCNYIHKIPDAIRSRSTEFKFKELPSDYITNFCIDILNKENIQYEKETIQKIIMYNSPDVRKIIQNLQKFSNNGKLEVKSDKELMDPEQALLAHVVFFIMEYLKRNKHRYNPVMHDIVSFCNNTEIDYVVVFKNLFNDKRIPVGVKIKVNEYLNKLPAAIFPSMHFISFMFEIADVLQGYLDDIDDVMSNP